MRNALMLAFHFPPFAQSSGVIRTLSFVRHLPGHNWQPIVLTARQNAYPETDRRSLEMIPAHVRVLRAPGVDVARHLAIAGRYPTWLATPDRWNTWAIAALFTALACVRRDDPAVLWATFPITSALIAAMAVHRLTKIPLVADLRDPLVYEGWPQDPWARRVYAGIERRLVAQASAVVVTTPGTRRLYVERYPHVPESRFRIIANGIDQTIDASDAGGARPASEPIVLVHSGLMEIPDRDPTSFFRALAAMRSSGEVTGGTLRVVLRATGSDDEYRRQIVAAGIADIVFVESRVPHSQAIDEMRGADGLLLFQGAQCNRQIPAKAYEYLGCGRPIIGLIDPAGDTHELIARRWNVPYVADMESVPAIVQTLRKFIRDWNQRNLFVPDRRLVQEHSRATGARQLAELFKELADAGAHA